MSTGLFAVGTAGYGPPSERRRAAYRAIRRKARERRMTELAELVANGWTISAAARSMGVSQQTGSSMFREICERLGEQAI